MKKPISEQAMHEAEIRGEIPRAPEFLDLAPAPAEEEKAVVVTKTGDFMFAISRAKLENLPYIEASKDIMDRILNGQPGNSVMYNGVRVFLEGSAEKTLREEAMNSENYGDMIARRKHQELMK